MNIPRPSPQCGGLFEALNGHSKLCNITTLRFFGTAWGSYQIVEKFSHFGLVSRCVFSSHNKWACYPAGRNIHPSFLPCIARCLKSRESSVEHFLKSQVIVCPFFLSDHDLTAWFISTDRASIYSLPFSVVKESQIQNTNMNYEISAWTLHLEEN